MPFKKGHKLNKIQEDRFNMSLKEIADELGTTENDILCTIYGAMNKLRRDRYKYLEEYQYADHQRDPIAGCSKPTTL